MNIPEISRLVTTYGAYYCPAWKHYNRQAPVACDKCNKQNLKACIGFDKYDLCLKCVSQLTELSSPVISPPWPQPPVWDAIAKPTFPQDCYMANSNSDIQLKQQSSNLFPFSHFENKITTKPMVGEHLG